VDNAGTRDKETSKRCRDTNNHRERVALKSRVLHKKHPFGRRLEGSNRRWMPQEAMTSTSLDTYERDMIG
jgi:hypothetical protein